MTYRIVIAILNLKFDDRQVKILVEVNPYSHVFVYEYKTFPHEALFMIARILTCSYPTKFLLDFCAERSALC